MAEPNQYLKTIPKSSFGVYLSEGDVYFRRRRFVSAIKAYSLVRLFLNYCLNY